MKVLVTGASGNAGQVVCKQLVEEGFDIRRCDVAPPMNDPLSNVEFVRCDTRTDADVRSAVNKKIGFFGPIVHTHHDMPSEVIGQFRT